MKFSTEVRSPLESPKDATTSGAGNEIDIAARDRGAVVAGERKFDGARQIARKQGDQITPGLVILIGRHGDEALAVVRNGLAVDVTHERRERTPGDGGIVAAPAPIADVESGADWDAARRRIS